ncbi:hypothetical protein [Methylobacter sp. YRD-M1]|uniref:hypothetical protein n=1 Tax=Methylobacter sp. YRD-M1 TaxID=2911520 RepID=UPI00227A04DC|nr:hypothetical protein [Methylobacter sp. YRD-M1]WAK00586.1 hypothetical protein LZ558_12065 [Methylobacter sp. YRD-M1]
MPLKELQSWLEQEQALSISISAIDKFIRHKLGYRYKKTLIAREQWQARQQTCDLSRSV